MTAIDPLPRGRCSGCDGPRVAVAQCGGCDKRFCRHCLEDQLQPWICRPCFRKAAREFHKRMAVELFYTPDRVTIWHTSARAKDAPFSWVVQVTHRNGHLSTGLASDFREALYAAHRKAEEDARHGRTQTSNKG